MSEIKSVDVMTAAQWLKQGEAVLIDVREPEEFKAMSIDGAFHIPLADVNLEKIDIPAHEHKKWIIHCRSGRRSYAAAEKLLQHGATSELYNLEGGILAWEAAGLPVKTLL